MGIGLVIVAVVALFFLTYVVGYVLFGRNIWKAPTMYHRASGKRTPCGQCSCCLGSDKVERQERGQDQGSWMNLINVK